PADGARPRPRQPPRQRRRRGAPGGARQRDGRRRQRRHQADAAEAGLEPEEGDRLRPPQPHRAPELAMRSGVPMRLVLCLGVLAGAAGAQPAPASLPVTVTLGVEGDGTATAAWRDALRVWHGDEALGLVLRDQHALTEEEAAWAALIQRRAPAWARMTDSLRLPFEGVVPPDTVHVVLGNVGGQDAFTFSDSTMGFDLQRLGALYGEATAAENGDRIDRFFAHEFTHLMH